jgi:hypothetical protein
MVLTKDNDMIKHSRRIDPTNRSAKRRSAKPMVLCSVVDIAQVGLMTTDQRELEFASGQIRT